MTGIQSFILLVTWGDKDIDSIASSKLMIELVAWKSLFSV